VNDAGLRAALPIYCTGGCDACRAYAEELGVPFIVPVPSPAPAGPTPDDMADIMQAATGGPDFTVKEWPPAPAALDVLPRLWWCSGWGTLNEKRYHGNDGPCPGQSCGQVAYVRDSDLRAATRPAEEGEK